MHAVICHALQVGNHSAPATYGELDAWLQRVTRSQLEAPRCTAVQNRLNDLDEQLQLFEGGVPSPTRRKENSTTKPTLARQIAARYKAFYAGRTLPVRRVQLSSQQSAAQVCIERDESCVIHSRCLNSRTTGVQLL